MKRVVTTLAMMVVIALVAAPAITAEADKKKKKKKNRSRATRVVPRLDRQLSALELSDEQKAKLKELRASLAPKLVAARKKGKLSKTQREARSQAQKKAKSEGKKGKAIRAAVAAAAELTDDQKAAQAEIRKLQGEYRRGVMGMLTADQIAKAGIKQPKKRKKKKKKKKDQAAA